MDGAKFKLIKKYPGSPKLGTIVTKNYYNYQIYAYAATNLYPEFWEEVVKKDYEILSFKQINGVKDLWTNFGTRPDCWCRNDNGTPVTTGYTLEGILNNPMYQIYSIKRLSDGEIFTIDDNVYSILGNKNSWKNCYVKSFEIKNNKLKFVIIENEITGVYNLEELAHFKKPLFTTEDGVDIFEGDKYWIAKQSDKPYECIATNNSLLCDKKYIFSTKYKAIDWYILNKDCISINEISKIINSYQSYRIIPKLIELVQSKM